MKSSLGLLKYTTQFFVYNHHPAYVCWFNWMIAISLYSSGHINIENKYGQIKANAKKNLWLW